MSIPRMSPPRMITVPPSGSARAVAIAALKVLKPWNSGWYSIRFAGR